QIRRIGRKVKHAAAGRFDRVPYFSGVMSTEVVEDHDGAVMNARAKYLRNELDEPRLVHRTHHRAVTDDAVVLDCTDNRQVFSPVGGLGVPHSGPRRSATVRDRHRDVASGLINENEVVRIYAGDFFEERPPLFLDVGAILLGGAKGLFFRVTPARRRARPRLDALSSPPYRSTHALHSSGSVRSGFSATS